MDPKVPLYEERSCAAWAIPLAGVLGVVATFASVAIAVWLVWPRPQRESVQAWLYLMAGIWGVGGPMWFFSEYFSFYRRSGLANTWEQFKHGQQVSASIWAGLSVSLAALGSSDLARGSSDEWNCSVKVSSAGSSASGPAGEVILTNCSRSAH